MPYNVNVNNFSTPFSTQASIIGARNEERRLEHIYGGSGPRRMTHEEYNQMTREKYKRGKELEVADLAHLGTHRSSAHVVFAGRHYILPPTRSQEYGDIIDHGNFDAHFGGLGLSKSMLDWKDTIDVEWRSNNIDANIFNAQAQKKAQGGLFRKRGPEPTLVPHLDHSRFLEVMNRKLAAARIPVAIKATSKGPLLLHPSSESGDLMGEMSSWAQQHWTGVAYRPWQNDVLLVLPEISLKQPFTQKDADNLVRTWEDFLARA